MDLTRNIGLSLIAVSCLVIGIGFFLIRYYTPEPAPLTILNTDWTAIEATVEKDIGSIGYQFLSHGDDIPAIEQAVFETCLRNYAELRLVDRSLSREYLFKYNQIVHIRMLRVGIDCRE